MWFAFGPAVWFEPDLAGFVFIVKPVLLFIPLFTSRKSGGLRPPSRQIGFVRSSSTYFVTTRLNDAKLCAAPSVHGASMAGWRGGAAHTRSRAHWRVSIPTVHLTRHGTTQLTSMQLSAYSSLTFLSWTLSDSPPPSRTRPLVRLGRHARAVHVNRPVFTRQSA